MTAFNPDATSPPGNAITPAEMRHAYGIDQIMFGSVAGDGTGQTIAIIDAYNYPTVASDLQQFDATFGLPDLQAYNASGNTGAYLRVVSQTGSTTLPSTDPAGAGASAGTWEEEEALDVEWAHSVAPGANIILVEANDPTDPNLITAAVGWARQQPGVSAISMSFSQGETSSEKSSDSLFTTPTGHTGITFFAATGDDGEPSGYPAFSPNVVAVGGTTLAISGSNYQSESGWSDSGGSLSTIEAQPSYQNGVVTQSTTARGNPDVALDADPNSGVPIYDSYDFGGSPWQVFGGTSLATPMWAGIMAIVDQGLVLNGQTPMDGRTQTLPKLYSLPSSDFHDITTGNNGFAAGPGYDLVTGLGTPVANLLVANMVVPPTGTPGTVTLNANSDTGFSNSDDITALDNSSRSKELTFNVGSTIAGATVSIYADGNLIGTTLATGTTTTLTTNGAYTLASGTYSITATQTQTGLGQSGASTALSLDVDTTPPTITAQNPGGTTAGAQSDLKLTFSEPIDTTSFNLSDVTSFVGPANLDLRSQITGFAWSAGNTVLDIQFTSQSAVGTYLLTLGPSFIDLAGNAMAVPYSASFTVVAAIYAASMDSNPGWTFTAGSLWQWGQPLGGGSHFGDPVSGHTGANVIGYNLSGDYTRNAPVAYATTPAIDATNYQSLTLSFWRWLGVNSRATASVQASPDGGATWVTLWSNNGTTISDNSWVQQTFTLPASFNGQPDVLFRWAMGPTGTSSTTYPGWNIDDILVTGAPYVPPSISGQVFVDANGNGALDPGEAGMPGVPVFLDLNNNGVQDPGGNYTVASTNVPVAIPDLSTATSTLTVANANGPITGLTITLNISHTFDSDLTATLIAPDGTPVTLFANVGGSGQNFSGTTFSDSATRSINSGVAPFSGTYQPSPGVLAALNGKLANGVWTLKVVDSVRLDSGTINSWSISFGTAGEPSTTTDSNGNYQFNVAAGTYTVREVTPASYVPVTAPSHTVAVTAAVTGQNFANFPTTFAAPADGTAFDVSLDSTGTTLLISTGTAASTTPAFQIAAALAPSLTFDLSGNNQNLVLDFSNGSPLALTSIILNSTHGNGGQLTLLGAGSSQTFTMNDQQIALASGGDALSFNNMDIVDLKNAAVDYSGTLSTVSNLIVDAGTTLFWS